MQRIQKEIILKDLKKKLVFIVGPRQVGKTWLSKEIMKEYKNPLYLSYDSLKDRKTIKSEIWPSNTDLIVFDEIHKMPKWKTYLKGIFDTKKDDLYILITGSASMNAHRNAGDSMAGRFRLHHLMPISIKELKLDNLLREGSVNKLTDIGGFPEPYFSKSKDESLLWLNSYADTLLREDIFDFKYIDNFKAIKDVFELIRTKVGSPISYSSIAENVGISSATVKSYISILESLYIIFLIKPYTKKVHRSILKEPKVYFYNTGFVQGDEGVKFENMIAVSLLKHAHAQTDETGKVTILATLRNKQKNEVDFVLVENEEVKEMVEVKLSESKLSEGLKYFNSKYGWKGYQVVRDLRYALEPIPNMQIVKAEEYLKTLYI
ncbi:MAG: hypothetical protein UU24_C0003G0019 [Candidatus Nomurabacteria bacterium GW2011_GWA2_40_9]|uniref:AAA+ ATPase domain-containing protein n=1 Tax=Candidatus Nomurabacteria bacterium GW2011_GWA2_40_9 TaxID=1618734 RepID=A0A0G0TRV7_9BACT|nr:MAG: hypothetical protein UU24_C0003G0019 [Candidatus Nomurabacteria bacterium GW2011_GWA2_40_9]